MKNIVKIFLLAVLLTGFTSIQAQKIGHINSFELLSLMPEVKKVDDQLASLAQELDGQYQAYLVELQKKYKEYEANFEAWTETKRDATETDIKNLENRIREFESTSQEKVSKKREELLAPLLEKAEKAINEVGAENGFMYIIDSSTGALVFSGQGAIDVLPLVKIKLNLQ